MPANLPNWYGFGANDKFDTGASFGPHKWKQGQGAACWDYSYAYLNPGWRTWAAPDGEWARREINSWGALGQIQVFTMYYAFSDPNRYMDVNVMNGFWGDLAKLMEIIRDNAPTVTILHLEPDLIGFWNQQGAGVSTPGKVKVGSSTPVAPFPAVVNGLAWNTTNFPDTIQGWNKAIWHLRQHYSSTKILLAHHFTHWATGVDIFANPSSVGVVNTGVDGATAYISSIENGLPFDLFFADPADRDADFWRVYNCFGGANSRWAAPDYNYTWGSRSWGTEAYAVDRVSTNLNRRGMMWQIPVGNTYYRTVNNSNGHYRDNRAQGYIPSTSANGSTGFAGDAYSVSDTTTGPGFWASHGIIATLYGSGGFNNTPTPCDGAGQLLSHVRDRVGDFTTNPVSDNGPGGPVYNAWGQAISIDNDDDGGYIRRSLINYCAVGKYPLGPVPTFTPTPTVCVCSPTATPTVPLGPIDCPAMFNGAESIAENGTWAGGNASRSIVVSPLTQGSGALRIQINTTSGWNNQMANLTGFSPNVWQNYTRLTMDVWIDPANTPWTVGSGWHELAPRLSSGVKVQQSFTAPLVFTLNTGWNSLDMIFDWPAGTILSSDILDEISFILNQDGTALAPGVMHFDNIVLHTDAACPPASPTITATQTPTDTSTRTHTGTITGTATPTATVTSSTTATATVTRSPTPSASPSYSSTPTFSASPSASPSFSATSSATSSATQTTTATATLTVTATQTKTGTLTQTPTTSGTGTKTNTSTVTGTLTSSETATVTQSQTETPTKTSTPTSSPTFSITQTETYTPTATKSSTGTSTLTVTESTTDSPTPSFTFTSTRTFTPTASFSATPTRSNTGTSTPSGTQTDTSTVTPTRSNTATRTATSTETSTATVTPSITASPTMTETFTETPVLSPTPTSTSTATRTVSPTATATASATASATVSPTRTGTQSYTPVDTFTFTATLSDTPAETATLTVTPSVTPGDTFTLTATPSNTPANTATLTASATSTSIDTVTRTFTATFSPSPSATATANGSIDIWLVSANPLDTAAVPQGDFGPANSIVVRIETASTLLKALSTLVVTGGSGVIGGGVSFVDLGSGVFEMRFLPSKPLPVGSYSIQINAISTPGDCVCLTQTFSVIAGDGPNQVLAIVPGPNPNPVMLLLHLAGAVDEVEIDIYSTGLQKIGTIAGQGRSGKGWAQVPVAGTFMDALSNGTYYMVAVGVRNGTRGKSSKGKLVILR